MKETEEIVDEGEIVKIVEIVEIVDEEDEGLMQEVAIKGDGDCFYSATVEAFNRNGRDITDLPEAEPGDTGVKCLRRVVASAITPDVFKALQENYQAGLED